MSSGIELLCVLEYFVVYSRLHRNVMYCPPLQGNPSSWIWRYYIFCSYSGRMFINCFKQTLENTEGWIKYGQSGETGNIGYTRRRKKKHNMCWTPLYANKHK